MEYLSTREAAAYLGYTHGTLTGYVATGRIVPDIRLHKKAFGFTKATLDAFRERHPPRLTAEQWAEAGRRFHAGETIYKVARDYGVDPEYLHRKVGPRGRRASPRPPELWEAIRLRYLAGETAASLSAEYSVSVSAIYQRVGARKGSA